MANEDYGESSKKLNLNGSDRPLKKARYVWELKGKYHLKEALKQSEKQNNEKTEKERPPANDIRIEEPRVEPENEIQIDDSENNNVTINNNQEDCCREALLAEVDQVMTIPIPSPVSVSSSEDDSSEDEGSDSHVPVSLVPEKQQDYEYHLKHWQALQVARGFVDNTINKVIETCGINNDRELQQIYYLDMCQVLANSPFDNIHIEGGIDVDEGVLLDAGISVAIQSHGLQTVNSNAKEPYNARISNGENEPSRDNSLSEAANAVSDSGNNTDSMESMSCDSTNHQEQDDFMNAAVSAAIQNKGLSAYS